MNECNCGTCSICRAIRKEVANKDKPKKVQKPLNKSPIKKKIVEKKPIDLEALKGKNVQLKNSKRVLSEEELVAKAKEKERLKKEKDKARAKTKREEKKYAMTNLFVLYQKFIRLVTPDICASCGCIVGEQGRQKQSGHCHPKGRYKSVSLLVNNMFSQCNVCNAPFSGDGMMLDLYKYGCKFWGVDTMDLVHDMTKVSYSFDKGERLELFNYIQEKIKEAEKLTQLKHKEILLRQVWEDQQQTQWFKNIIEQIKNNK